MVEGNDSGEQQIGGEEKPLKEKVLTYGQKAVGLTFNPSGLEEVDLIKHHYADIIDLLNDLRSKEPTYTENNVLSHKANLLTEAIKQAQTAQMWAVKALTWK